MALRVKYPFLTRKLLELDKLPESLELKPSEVENKNQVPKFPTHFSHGKIM